MHHSYEEELLLINAVCPHSTFILLVIHWSHLHIIFSAFPSSMIALTKFACSLYAHVNLLCLDYTSNIPCAIFPPNSNLKLHHFCTRSIAEENCYLVTKCKHQINIPKYFTVKSSNGYIFSNSPSLTMHW